MKMEWKQFAAWAGLFALVLICVRPSNRASLREESIPTAMTAVAESKHDVASRWPSPAFRTAPQPVSELETKAPRELPDDPDALREWARHNPVEAMTWLGTAAAGETRDVVVEIVCARVAETNPAEAVSLAERYSGGCSNLLENLIHQWAEQNEPAAAAYAMSQAAGNERDRLLSRIALARSRENPAEAAKLVAEWIAPGEVQSQAAISVLHQWTTRDPHAALAWAQLFPDEVLRERALKEIANMLTPRQE
jgi:hypothetical protein